MAPETKEQILLRKFARHQREPGNLERKIFHGDALDEMTAASREDRETLAAKLDELAEQPCRRVDLNNNELTPRDRFFRDTRSMWKSARERTAEGQVSR